MSLIWGRDNNRSRRLLMGGTIIVNIVNLGGGTIIGPKLGGRDNRSRKLLIWGEGRYFGGEGQ